MMNVCAHDLPQDPFIYMPEVDWISIDPTRIRILEPQTGRLSNNIKELFLQIFSVGFSVCTSVSFES